MFRFISRLFRRELYPEIRKAGGFAIAVNTAFESINSVLRVEDEGDIKLPFDYCCVKKDNKYSQIYIAAKVKFYIMDFWRDGVCLGNGKTEDISQLAQVIDYWMTHNITTLELSGHFNFVHPTEKAEAFDENREVAYTWNLLATERGSLGLHEFINLARENETLNKLFPFTSLYTFCFSKCTGYPFDTTDLPNVTLIEYVQIPLSVNVTEYAARKYGNPIPRGQVYVVTKNNTEFIGMGNAEEALKIVCDALPEGIGPARKGAGEY